MKTLVDGIQVSARTARQPQTTWTHILDKTKVITPGLDDLKISIYFDNIEVIRYV